jgi:uncharacterized membrane protein
VFAAVGLIGILLISSPALAELIHLPGGEQFSELYLLGPEKMAKNLPFNVVADQKYTVYLGVGNHLGESSYYVCYVKLRNQLEPLPNETAQTPSSIAPLYEYRPLIQNEANWTVPLIFSLSGISTYNNQTLLQSLTINNQKFTVNKIAQFNQDNNGYYYQIFVELWALNSSSNVYEYQNRYVYFWLNATSISS